MDSLNTPPAGALGDPNAAKIKKRTTGYPPYPKSFNRGNTPLPGTVATSGRAIGNYFGIFGFGLVLGLFFLWAWTSNWAYEDGNSLKVRPRFWSTIFLAAGLAGFLGIFTIPNFYLGFFLLAVAYGLPTGLYVFERNGRVPESAKILTQRHIQDLTIRTLAKMGLKVGKSKAVEQAIGPPITFIGKSGTGRGEGDRSRQVESSRGYLSAKEVVYDAILRRATDVHFEPKEEELSIRLRIDGVMYPTEPFDKAVGDAVMNIMKVLGNMDITEKRRPQDGSFRAEMDDREIDFRVATQGTRFGEKMSLRILDQSSSVSKLKQLGMRKPVQERIRSMVDQPHGLILACGPTGAGKSTTLYALLNEIDAYQRNIITVEDPVEYKMDGVSQIEINSKAGQSFATSLRSILRQDPDVVMIGEIRDGETAEVACQAANTGHMVFSTVHANDTFTALYRMMSLGVEPFMLSSSISAIIGQRLTRKLCPDCREGYKPNPDLLKKANLPVEKIKQFYRPPKQREEPCTTCGSLGFKGRVGVYEFLEIQERMRDMIRENAPMSNIKAEARKAGMLYMREEGLRLVVRGATSVDEMMRVVK